MTVSGGDAARIRPLAQKEWPALADFLYLAIFVPPGCDPPPRSILREPGVAVYLDGFGTRPGDTALCAELDGELAGAVWVRRIHGYGYLDDHTPEFALSVAHAARRQGIGLRLMRAMLARLRQDGVRQASLAVQKRNLPALALYQRLGFETVGETGEEWIMRVRLDGE